MTLPIPTPRRLQTQHTGVLLVDVQEKLLPHIHNHEQVTGQVGRLLEGARVLGLPVVVTEQYRKGLGVTVPAVASKLPAGAPCFEKLAFSACTDDVTDALRQRHIHSVLVCGIEAHVCVLQTCLDLLEDGFTAALVTDAVGSRRREDQEAAVQRMVQAGALPTTVESALLELVGAAGGAVFKAMLPVIK